MGRSFYLLAGALLSSHLLAASTPVLDRRGNPITPAALYTVRKSGIHLLGALTLRAYSNSTCADHVAFSTSEVDPGTAVRFLPYDAGAALSVGHDHRFRVEFAFPPGGAGNWTVGEEYAVVVAGGGETSYFAVLPPADAAAKGYSIGYCRACALCRNLCSPVGLDGDGFLRISPEASPLKVYFTMVADLA